MATELAEPVAYNIHPKKPLSVWRNHHIWYIAILMIVCSILYYLDVILDFVGLPNPGWSVFLIAHDWHLLLFSIPLLYAAYIFRIRGIAIIGVILVLIFIPRAIFTAPYLEPLLRAAVFLAFAVILGILIAYVQNRRDQAIKAYAVARQSEERFRNLFGAMSEGVLLTDVAGHVLKINPTAERILGFGHSEIQGLTYDSAKLELIHPDGSPLLPEEMPSLRAAKEKRPVMGDVTGLKHPDGTNFWFIVNAIPLLDEGNEFGGVVTTFTDITELKEAEKQLLTAETAIRTCISAIATADLDGNLTYVNPTFLKIWGYDNLEEVLDRNFADLCKEKEKAQAVMQTLLARKGTEAAELVGRKKDGTEFIVGLRAALIVDVEGRPIGMTASLADITERRKAEKEKKL
jgi:PAS domain S-box-containing protein